MNPEFLSGEASASPAVEPMLDALRTLGEAGLSTGAMSVRNGSRATTHADAPFGALTNQQFVEVADYDPHLDRLMMLGRHAAHRWAGMHALMLRAKKEINVVLTVDTGGRELPADVPRAQPGGSQLQDAMNALEGSRASDAVLMGTLLIVTGVGIKQVAARARALAEA